MLDINVLQVFLQILAIAIVEVLTHKWRKRSIQLIPFPPVVVFSFISIFPPREQLQHTIGVIMCCIDAIAVDLVIALKGRR